MSNDALDINFEKHERIYLRIGQHSWNIPFNRSAIYIGEQKGTRVDSFPLKSKIRKLTAMLIIPKISSGILPAFFKT